MGRRHKHKKTNRTKRSTDVATPTTHSAESVNESQASSSLVASTSKVPDDREQSRNESRGSSTVSFAGFRRGFLNANKSSREEEPKERLSKTVQKKVEEFNLPTSEVHEHKRLIEEPSVMNDETDKEVEDSKRTLDKTVEENGNQSEIKDAEAKRKNFGGLSSGFLNVSSSKRSCETEKSTHVSSDSEASPFETVDQDAMAEMFNKLANTGEGMPPHFQSMVNAMMEQHSKAEAAKTEAAKTHAKVKEQCMGLEELKSKVRQNEKLMKYFKDEKLKQRFAKFKTCSDEVLTVENSTDPVDVDVRGLLEELGNFLNEQLPETT